MALYAPMYSRRLRIVSAEKEWKHGSGTLRVRELC
jgi:diphthamide synthase (EF-2-diphthine--ammonia ligase)